jgi:hypothetical protein
MLLYSEQREEFLRSIESQGPLSALAFLSVEKLIIENINF